MVQKTTLLDDLRYNCNSTVTDNETAKNSQRLQTKNNIKHPTDPRKRNCELPLRRISSNQQYSFS